MWDQLKAAEKKALMKQPLAILDAGETCDQPPGLTDEILDADTRADLQRLHKNEVKKNAKKVSSVQLMRLFLVLGMEESS